MTRTLARNGWLLGLVALLAVLLVVTKLIQPTFGASAVESVARASLPFAFATAGMAVVVIAGGIDLSIAALMAIASVTAARLMEGAGDGQTVLVILFVLVLGMSLLAGLWTTICATFPALSALEAGYQVYIVADACGRGWV